MPNRPESLLLPSGRRPYRPPDPNSDRRTAARFEAAMRIPTPLALSACLHPYPQRAVRPPPRLPALSVAVDARAREREKTAWRGNPGHWMASGMLAISCTLKMRFVAGVVVCISEAGKDIVSTPQDAAIGCRGFPDSAACSIRARMLSTRHAVVLGESLTGSG